MPRVPSLGCMVNTQLGLLWQAEHVMTRDMAYRTMISNMVQGAKACEVTDLDETVVMRAYNAYGDFYEFLETPTVNDIRYPM